MHVGVTTAHSYSVKLRRLQLTKLSAYSDAELGVSSRPSPVHTVKHTASTREAAARLTRLCAQTAQTCAKASNLNNKLSESRFPDKFGFRSGCLLDRSPKCCGFVSVSHFAEYREHRLVIAREILINLRKYRR